jgi:hypothetical protein
MGEREEGGGIRMIDDERIVLLVVVQTSPRSLEVLVLSCFFIHPPVFGFSCYDALMLKSCISAYLKGQFFSIAATR